MKPFCLTPAAAVTAVMCTTLYAQNPFSIAIIPDTQNYLNFNASGFTTDPSKFDAQVQSIVNQQGPRNIVFATHLGDIVDDGASPERQWTSDDGLYNDAHSIMSRFDAPGVTLPYSVTIGNHDYDTVSDLVGSSNAGTPADTFATYFGPDRYAGRAWYGGGTANGLNHYQTFDGGGRTFLHLNLEMQAPNEALAWAQGVIDTHPGMATVISTHKYLNANGKRTVQAENTQGFGNSGQVIYDTLVRPNEQVFLVLTAHRKVNAPVISVVGGERPVYQILTNYSESSDPRHGPDGNGWMNLLDFRPDDHRLVLESFSPVTGEAAPNRELYLDFDHRFDLGPAPATQSVTFQQGIDGYRGTKDTYIYHNATPETAKGSRATSGTLSVDGDVDTSNGVIDETMALLRFEDLIGFAPGQITQGTAIHRATLTLDTTGKTAHGVQLFRLLQNWSDTWNWDDWGDGVQFDGVEAALDYDADTFSIEKGATVIDVTRSVQAWIDDPSSNHGWAFVANGNDGWAFSSAQFSSSDRSRRPLLTIETLATPAFALRAAFDPIAIPEPATLGVLLAGGPLLMLRRRRGANVSHRAF